MKGYSRIDKINRYFESLHTEDVVIESTDVTRINFERNPLHILVPTPEQIELADSLFTDWKFTLTQSLSRTINTKYFLSFIQNNQIII